MRRRKRHVDRLVEASDAGAARRPMSLGALCTTLKNPIYLARISHKGEVFHGLYEPIVDDGRQ